MDKLFKVLNLKIPAILAILLFLGIMKTFGQDSLVIKGAVVDGSGRPLQNVSVGVEGSGELPAVTNENGEFTITSTSSDVWLNVAPSSGYKAKRIYLANRTEIKIFLTPNELEAGEDKVLIMTIPELKRNMAYSFSSVNVNDISETPSLSVDQYMQGKVAGMHVLNRSGDPGVGAVSFLRGVNSINNTNAPLYVVDGIPLIRTGVFNSAIDGFEYNQLLVVSPMDISQTTIVKDPALTAAYGSKASNGLIFIETLDPSSTQTAIDLDLRFGYSLAPDNQIPQLNADQHKTLISEELFSSGMEEELIKEEYPNLFLQPGDDNYFLYSHNTNWQDLIFTDAALTNLGIKVKGGDEIARYGLSFGYVNAEGIVKSTSFKGYNLRFRGLLNIFRWLKMNSGVSLSYNNSVLKESARVAETSPILTSLAKSPLLNPYQYDDDGNELDLLADVDELGVSNPLAVIQKGEANNNNFNSTVVIGFTGTVNDKMNISTNFGLNYAVLQERVYMPNNGMELYFNDEAINVSKASNNSLFTFYNNTAFNYFQDFGNHRLGSVTGVNIQTNSFQYDYALTKNASENDQYKRLQDGINNLREIGGLNRNWNWLSFYERLSYSYKDKYFAQASISLDGSSRIGENASNTVSLGGQLFGIFYSSGLAWRLSNESFFRNIAAIEDLKIRLSYGRTGNDDIGEANSTKYYMAIKFRETTGLVPAVLPNDQLSYETVSQMNAGLDLALWGNRLTMNIDAYKSVTENMLVYVPLKNYFGYDVRPENGGTMQNRGIDVNLFARLINMHHFKWDIHATYSTNENEVTDIVGDKLITPVLGGEVINTPGEKANSFYGYIFEGVYSTTEDAQNSGLVNNKFVPFQAGDAIFKDLSGPDGQPDGIINSYDKTIIGSSMPKHWGGLGTTLTYKRWSLSVFAQFVSGNDIFNYLRSQNESMTGIENQNTTVLDRWQYEGQETMVPRALYGDVMGNSDFSTRWIEDGSYVRVKNIALSYTVPSEFLVFKHAKFYISASNIFTRTNYLGYDPDFSYSSSHVTQGIDYGLTPQPRQFIAGIKLGF